MSTPEERSADARRYDYLAFVRVANLLRAECHHTGEGSVAQETTIDVCALRAFRVWHTLDKTQRELVDPRFRPGGAEGP